MALTTSRNDALVSVAAQPDESSENYLASVSDLMSGLIFIFVLTLLLFAMTYNQVTSELTDAIEIRDEILEQLRAMLERDGVRVQVGEGILRLPESILFPIGSAELTPQGQQALRSLARSLSLVLPCYVGSPGDPVPEGCGGPDRRGKLDAVFIEGHTDDIPIRNARFASNWELSVARALRTYQALVAMAPELDRLHNYAGQPLFSVSGYADRRPVAPNTSESNRQLNRRIDIRLVVATPRLSEVMAQPLRSVAR